MKQRQPVLLFIIGVVTLAILACGVSGGGEEAPTPTIDLDFSRSQATAAGCVWYDDNRNGVFEDDEEAVVGQPVAVRDPGNLGGAALGTGVTGETGCYEIPFTYEVNPRVDDEFVIIVQRLTCCEFTMRPAGDAGLITSAVDGNGRGDLGDLYVDAGVVRSGAAADQPAGGEEAGAGGENGGAAADPPPTPTAVPEVGGIITDTGNITATMSDSGTAPMLISWEYTYVCATGEPVSGINLEDIDLEGGLDLDDIEITFDDETGEIGIVSIALEELIENGILNLDWGGGPLLNFEPSAENPLGGGGVSDAVFIENGVVTGAIRAVNTDDGPLFLESTATGTVNGSTAALTLNLDHAPGGATQIGGGFTDGVFCFLPFPPNEQGLALRPLTEIGIGGAIADQVASNPRLFCNHTAGTCTASSGDFTAIPDGTFTITNTGTITANGFFGRGPLTPEERVVEFSNAGWVVSEGELYATPLHDWFIHVLSTNGFDQGFFAVSEGIDGSNEVQIFVAAGTDLTLLDELLREILDNFRGPYSP